MTHSLIIQVWKRSFKAESETQLQAEGEAGARFHPGPRIRQQDQAIGKK